MNAPGMSSVTLTNARLPQWAPALVGVMALAAAGLPAMLFGWGVVGWVVVALFLFLVGLPAWSLAVENRRAALDRLMTGLIWSSFGLAVLPLIWLIYVVVSEGLQAISMEFLTYSMRGVTGDEQGGVYHALIGTLLITAAATLISVPIGVLSAIYLVEYGGTSRLARWITFLVDVMTGIPSIVAGLFALALVVLFFGPAYRMGLGRLDRPVPADDPDRRPVLGGDVPAGPHGPARGGVRARRAEVADHPQGRRCRRPSAV